MAASGLSKGSQLPSSCSPRHPIGGLQRWRALPPSATTTLMPKSPDLKQLFTLPGAPPAGAASTVINADIRVGGHHPALGGS